MKVINPYLMFAGQAGEAIDFYKNVFAGTEVMTMRYKDAPQQGGRITEADGEKIMHASIDLGNGNILMISDVPASMYTDFKKGDNISLAIGADSKEEADRLFKGLAEGGDAKMPMADQFWGDYYGMLTDKYGNDWMISYTKAQHQQ